MIGRAVGHVHLDPCRLGHELGVSHGRGECRAHDCHALARNVGRQGVGSAEFGARKDKPHELALFGGLRVVEDGRHLGDFRDRHLLRAQEKDDLAVADELLVDAKLTVRGASPLHLAARRAPWQSARPYAPPCPFPNRHFCIPPTPSPYQAYCPGLSRTQPPPPRQAFLYPQRTPAASRTWMASMMTHSDWLAVIALIISSGGFAINLRNWFMSGPQLHLSIMADAISVPDDGKGPRVALIVTNRGTTATMLTHMVVYSYPSWWAKWRKREVLCSLVNSPAIPFELDVNKTWMGFMFY